MEIEIRRATEADLAAVLSLWQRCYSIPWSETAIRNELFDEGSDLLVATLDGSFAGYALMKGTVDAGELCNIAVEQDLRRGGAGRALVCGLAAEAVRRGYDAIYLEVRASNTAAIALYESVGFVRAGERKNYYRAPREDALLYNYYLKKDDRNEDTQH